MSVFQILLKEKTVLKQQMLRRMAMLFIVAVVVPLMAACGGSAPAVRAHQGDGGRQRNRRTNRGDGGCQGRSANRHFVYDTTSNHW